MNHCLFSSCLMSISARLFWYASSGTRSSSRSPSIKLKSHLVCVKLPALAFSTFARTISCAASMTCFTASSCNRRWLLWLQRGARLRGLFLPAAPLAAGAAAVHVRADCCRSTLLFNRTIQADKEKGAFKAPQQNNITNSRLSLQF